MRGAAVAIAVGLGILLSACSSEPDTVEPPPLVAEAPSLTVEANGAVVEVPPYDYCWESGGVGTCADWFGSQEATPIAVSGTSLQLSWIDDGELTGWFGPGLTEGCRTMRLSIRQDGPGLWTAALPEGSGSYTVTIHGSAAAGDTNFDISVEATNSDIPVDLGCPDER